MIILYNPVFQIRNIFISNTNWTLYIYYSKTGRFHRISKISKVQNQLPISFATALMCYKILKVRNSPRTHKNSYFCYLVVHKTQPKIYTKIFFMLKKFCKYHRNRNSPRTHKKSYLYYLVVHKTQTKIYTKLFFMFKKFCKYHSLIMIFLIISKIKKTVFFLLISYYVYS